VAKESFAIGGQAHALVQQAHRQGDAAPMAHGPRRAVGAILPTLRALVLLIAGKRGPMDRQLGECQRLPLL